MAAIARNPLASVKPIANHFSATVSPWVSATRRNSSASKRALSPDPSDGQSLSAKRARAAPEPPRTTREDPRKRDVKDTRGDTKEEKDRRRAEREEEFRVKYTRAFPNWTFHFDLETHQPELTALKTRLERRVLQLGAKVDDFFSKEVTHLITFETEEIPGNKENSRSRNGGGLLASPIKLKPRQGAETRGSELVKKAMEFDIKIWNVEKLTSVLDRCLAPPTPGASTSAIPSVQPSASTPKDRQLSRLLESERLHGTTERDPTQRRHDYIYFSKGSYYVLVEDMRQELATIAALEYTVQKGRDGKDHGAWPVLYCHPRARNPFLEYNEREERRREKMDQADREREEELARRKAQVREEERRRRAKIQAEARHRDLRRAISMQNMRQRAAEVEVEIDQDADLGEGDPAESAAASGYLASGTYVAASGNSVSITSATGTTSTIGASFRSMQLPASLRDKIDNQVVTSRRLPNAGRRTDKENLMGPPLVIPERPARMLRKSKSTTTMRLTKRDEGTKPGYCECCRVKFEDFKQHIYSKRHRKFAEDDSNFAKLDMILSRVRRRTVEEVAAERAAWDCSMSDEDDSESEDEDDDQDQDLAHDPDDADAQDVDLKLDYDGDSDAIAAMQDDDIEWNDWVKDDS